MVNQSTSPRLNSPANVVIRRVRMNISRICCFPASSRTWYVWFGVCAHRVSRPHVDTFMQEKLNESIVVMNKALQVRDPSNTLASIFNLVSPFLGDQHSKHEHRVGCPNVQELPVQCSFSSWGWVSDDTSHSSTTYWRVTNSIATDSLKDPS